MLHVLLATAFSLGALAWQLPTGWESLPPPRDQGFDYIFEPLKRGGPVITIAHSPRDPHDTLKDVAADIAQGEQDDGRTIVGIANHPTCHGTQPGIDIQTTFGSIVSQFYHVTILRNTVYVLNYTYGARQQQDPNVRQSIDSICPVSAAPMN